jgi:uncharacterized protein (DUF2236 family)
MPRSRSPSSATTLQLPSWIQQAIDGLASDMLSPPGVPAVDFTQPRGEPALAPHGSMSWKIFKNPVAMFVGGVAAVILELAQPRVRTGVWEHSTFRTQPLARLQRTGLAAMVTVYGARSVAQKMIAGVVQRHGQVHGQTPAGDAYAATDVELLSWVQATAGFGFAHAFDACVRPLSPDEFDHFYFEGAPAARLYGALQAPTSRSEMQALFDSMAGRLAPSPVIFEFLEILRRTPILPRALRPAQWLLMRAAVEIVPPPLREHLGLGRAYGLNAFERRLVRWSGSLADRVMLAQSPAVQACRRLGLPDNYLYRRVNE